GGGQAGQQRDIVAQPGVDRHAAQDPAGHVATDSDQVIAGAGDDIQVARDGGVQGGEDVVARAQIDADAGDAGDFGQVSDGAGDLRQVETTGEREAAIKVAG